MLFDTRPMRSSMVWSAGVAPWLLNPLGGAARPSWKTSLADANATTERRAKSFDLANIVHERDGCSSLGPPTVVIGVFLYVPTIAR